ncbi:MAG TPA: hypothetical protein DEO70_02300 [Bacteroidales bacterium]|nr:MAG: hypothetical protein A2X11_05790 [Bacteroidetes bacterium GWE2_42_24]OFY31266.1 MAG: hypothetical protein A2X09_10600 [Bacteroidetes bacterium GWF2_43_11]PKP28014.1 MAG: hypothetical protein CVU06_00340 [Bacteroidetes bacterium HGW-Bacteroidetes-22]HBZ65639.1 hypothetical protein [Bacteroidales bacterium]
MKNFRKLFMLTFVAATVLFTSCSKDDTTDPTVNYPTVNFMTSAGYVKADITLAPGFEFLTGINASMNATSKEKLVKLTITRVFNNTPTIVLDSTINVEVLAYDNFYTTKTTTGVEKWIFAVTDKAGVKSEISYNITTEEAAGEIYSYEATLMGGRYNTNVGSFWSSLNNQVMLQNVAENNKNKVDFVYFYGDNNHASIHAPANEYANTEAWGSLFSNWSPRNATTFKTTNGVDWASVANDAPIVAQATGMTLTMLNELTVGQIIAFETAATSANPGKKGLFKVMAIEGTASTDRTIKLDIKIQK